MDFKALRHRLQALREGQEADSAGMPPSVALLEQLVNDCTDPDLRFELFEVLSSECLRYGELSRRVEHLTQNVAERPRDPVSLSMLADALARVEGREGDAIATIDRAVDIARQDDRLVRYALTSKARVALDLDNYDALEEAIAGLIEDDGKLRAEDAPVENDFVDRIQRERLDPTLLERFTKLKP